MLVTSVFGRAPPFLPHEPAGFRTSDVERRGAQPREFLFQFIAMKVVLETELMLPVGGAKTAPEQRVSAQQILDAEILVVEQQDPVALGVT
jgi:hypothetical protein